MAWSQSESDDSGTGCGGEQGLTLCDVRRRIREALTSEATAIERDTADNLKMVQRLNEFLVDFINLLWQKKLLHEDEEDAAKAQFGLTS